MVSQRPHPRLCGWLSHHSTMVLAQGRCKDTAIFLYSKTLNKDLGLIAKVSLSPES